MKYFEILFLLFYHFNAINGIEIEFGVYGSSSVSVSSAPSASLFTGESRAVSASSAIHIIDTARTLLVTAVLFVSPENI